MADGGKCLFMIIWLIILIFIGFLVAGFCAPWYILVHCITACISELQGIADILLKGVQFPHYCATRMMKGDPLF